MGSVIGSLFGWLASRRKNFVFLLGLVFCLGVSWATYRVDSILHFQVPRDLINKPVLIEGEIDDLLQIDKQHERFSLRLRQWEQKSVSAHVVLNWYEKFPSLSVGEVWRMTVKVKPPHGLENSGTVDFQRMLFFQGVQATGYVVNRQPAQLLAYHPWRYPINHLRQKIETKIMQQVADPALAAFIDALTTGSRALLTPSQSQIFQNTGTTYLIVISGLHISIIASLLYLLVNRLWRQIAWLSMWLPAPQAGAWGALLAAWFYGLLAGFTLPTQRALIMITVMMLGTLYFRFITFSRGLLFAFAVMVICQPFALLAISFWLSFVAIALIGYLLCARLGVTQSRFGRWCWLQVAISSGLVPLSLFYFQQLSAVTVIASFIALPWVELLLVPLCVIGAVIDLCGCGLAHDWWVITADMVMPIWWYLRELANLPHIIWYRSLDSLLLLVACHVGIVLLLAPCAWSLRWLAIVWLLPLFYPRVILPRSGELWLTLLDVGQGLSVVVETQQHCLLFDAGAKVNNFDAGRQVIAPALRYRHIKRIDRMVISHGDNDHRGGAATIGRQFPLGDILTSVPQQMAALSRVPVMNCYEGQAWQWDGVQFQILSPPRHEDYQGNNSSCVLKVTAQGQSLLLTGDIEKKREKWLLAHYPRELMATVLIAPHHGSRTSSSAAFVAAVNPRYVLFPLGYYNRYKFPAASVIARYQKAGARVLTTADVGAISMQVVTGGKITLNTMKQQPYFWQSP